MQIAYHGKKSMKTKNKKSKLYALWKQHLSLSSRLTEQQQIKRAKEFTRKGMKP
jgi:hypothetical protein